MPLSYLRPNPLEERRKITHHHRGLGQTSSAEDKDGDTSITSEPDLSVQPRSFTELRVLLSSRLIQGRCLLALFHRLSEIQQAVRSEL